MSNDLITLQLLYQMAYIDGDFSKEEKEYIDMVIKSKGITIENIDIESPVRLPAEEHERMEILYYLLFLIRADGNISMSESDLLIKMGVSLGFRPEMTARLIQVMKDHLHKRLDPEDLLQIIQAFMN